MAALLLAALVPGSAYAAVPDQPSGVSSGTPRSLGAQNGEDLPGEQSPEQAAAAQARDSGERVLVESLTTETSQTFANPNGTFTRVQHVKPVRVRKEGGWTPIDTTLVWASGGAVEAAASPADLRLSGGGDGPLASVAGGGHRVALSWPETLPVPTLSGDEATYGDVLPGVDLVVQATADGFSEVLVVKSREAAANPKLREIRFGVETNLQMRRTDSGGLEFLDSTGSPVFGAPTPWMWDSTGAGDAGARTASGIESSVEEPGTEAREAQVALAVTANEMVLTPAPEMLTSDATQYPLYIDPKLSRDPEHWAMVDSGHANQSYYDSSREAGVGRYLEDNGGVQRSFFAFDVGTYQGTQISQAIFRPYMVHAWNCQAREWRIKHVMTFTSGTTWTDQPGVHTTVATSTAAKKVGESGSCAAGTVEIDVTNRVDWTANGQGWATFRLGLYSSNESDYHFRWRFRNNPILEVTYNRHPSVPSNMAMSPDPGLGCPSDMSGHVNTDTPWLKAKGSDPDGGNVTVAFEYWPTGDSTQKQTLTESVASGVVADRRVLSGHLQHGVKYTWRAKATDPQGLSSAYTSICRFVVDTVPPMNNPTVSSDDFPEKNTGLGYGKTGSFSFIPALGENEVNDIAEYHYGFSEGLSLRATAAADGTAAVLVTPPNKLVNTLFVQAVDKAGNVSPRTEYVFYVGAASKPAGHWKLEETSGTTLADSSGNGRDATLAAGSLGLEPRIVDGGTVASFGGNASEYAQTGSPVLDTSQSFTVAAWVWLDDLNSWHTVVSQDGTSMSVFRLQYRITDNTWCFTMRDADAETGGLHKACAVTPTVGKWTHLAGVYDLGAGTVALYVDGVRLAETSFNASWNAGGPLAIGRAKHLGSVADVFAGRVSDVRVWQRVLFEDELAPLATDLVGDWRLDGGAWDDSGYGRDAAETATGVSWIADRSGAPEAAVHLDGSGWLETTGPAVRTDQSFTVSAWARLDERVWSTAVSQEGTSTSMFRLMYRETQDAWCLTLRHSETSTSLTHACAPATTGAWTHLVGVYDAAAGQVRLHVDGSTQPADTAAFAAPWNAAGPVAIGRGRFGGNVVDRFRGGIDDVRVYAGAMPANEIYRLHQS